MKLYWITFNSETNRPDDVIVLDENKSWQAQLGDDWDADEVDTVCEIVKSEDTNGRKYRITLELITSDNCDHSDFTESMDGRKCLDCGLEAA